MKRVKMFCENVLLKIINFLFVTSIINLLSFASPSLAMDDNIQTLPVKVSKWKKTITDFNDQEGKNKKTFLDLLAQIYQNELNSPERKWKVRKKLLSTLNENSDLETMDLGEFKVLLLRKIDNFDFLRKKYPSLLSQSGDSYVEVGGKEYVLKWIEEEQGGQEEFVKSLKTILGTNVYDSQLVQDYLQGSGEELRKNEYAQLNLLKGHKDEGFFKVFFQRKKKDHHCLEDILLSAEYMYQLVKNEVLEGENLTVLFLGRTPCLVQLAYEALLKRVGSHNQNVVHLNFSGHPDIEAVRKNQFSQKNPELCHIRDMVTSEKLEHYFSYIDSKDILGSSKIYIGDMIESGAGFNSFLSILHSYFEERGKEIPSLRFLPLTNLVYMEADPQKTRLCTFTRSGQYKDNLGTLSYPENKEYNIKPWSISTSVIPSSVLPLKAILDNDTIQTLYIHGLEYPAQKWTSLYDEERSTGGILKDSLYPYLQLNFKKLIDWHIKQYKLTEHSNG